VVLPYQQLELSAEQRLALDAERDRFHADMRQQETSISAAHHELLDLLAASPPDRQAISAAQMRIQERQAAVQQLVIDHLLTLQAAMNPDQRSRFLQLLRENMPSRGALSGDRCQVTGYR